MNDFFKPTPWDSIIFGIDTYEITALTPEALEKALQHAGHYTVKIDPLASKKLLHDFGFYYCDTLIEPYSSQERFIFFDHIDIDIDISNESNIHDLISCSQNTFQHGRFHRDFNLDKNLAELRYSKWVEQLHQNKSMYTLKYKTQNAGFFGIHENKLILHSLKEEYRGKGLAKYFWSRVSKELFKHGHNEVCSSISAANYLAVNLCASLGFRFRNPIDVYHLLVE